MKNTRPGRPVNVSLMNKAIDLRDKGLSMREISRVLQRDVRQVARWFDYAKNNNSDIIPKEEGKG